MLGGQPQPVSVKNSSRKIIGLLMGCERTKKTIAASR